MKLHSLKWILLFCVFQIGSISAEIPPVISHQGRLQVDGLNFSGVGRFKFAIVAPGRTAAATASAVTINGFLVAISVIDGGFGYSETPVVTINDVTGFGAVAVAVVSGGRISDITVQNSGHGYSNNPIVTIPPPLNTTSSTTTYWSNDSSSVLGTEPATATPIDVSNGIYNVMLGDAQLHNMAPLTADVFNHNDLYLRIWFSDGSNGFAQLIPDKRIATVPYAMIAKTIPDNSVTSEKLAPQSITTSKIAPNTIDITQLNFAPLTVEMDPKIQITSANTVPKWGGNALVNGTLTDNGNVGIGTSNPVAKLDINGDVAVGGNVVINASGHWVGNTAGLQGPAGVKGDTGPRGPAGPVVTSVAACKSGGDCSCSSKTIVRIDGNCTVTSDTGSCSAPFGGMCCVCGVFQ